MRLPMYRNNGDGRALVEHSKKRYYLGKYGTPESIKAYQRFIAGLTSGIYEPPEPIDCNATVIELAERYLLFAERYYATDGKPTGEFFNVRCAVQDFIQMFGEDRGDQIGPRMLLALQDNLASRDFARTTINSRINRIRRFIRWCVSREFLPAAIYQAVITVDGLRKGHSYAYEPSPVEPVSLEAVEATLRFVAPVVADMARIQYLCGMRPGEVCKMRLADIDRSGPVWFYRPTVHKGTWRGKSLIKAIPKAAQEILGPYFTDEPDALLFDPRASVEWWAQQVPRKTKVHRYELRKRAAAKKTATAKPRAWTTCSYGKAIQYGIARGRKAGLEIPDWMPNQLRHAIAGEVSRQAGQQAASRWLGHSRLDTTAIYDELNALELAQIAERVRLPEIAPRNGAPKSPAARDEQRHK